MTNHISLEGYQTSNMNLDGYADLHYGILVRNIPASCNTMEARVYDVGGNMASSGPVALSTPTATNWMLDFEDGLMPPAGWTKLTSSSGTGTSVNLSAAAAFSGNNGMLSTDGSSTETTTQRACVERSYAVSRFEWRAESMFRPASLVMQSGDNVYPVAFYNAISQVIAAATIRDNGTDTVAGVILRDAGVLTASVSSSIVPANQWSKWVLHLIRLGTRETTAVLMEDCRELARTTGDTRTSEPDRVRAGMALTSIGVTATMHSDEILVTDQCTYSATKPAAIGAGGSTPLMVTKNLDGSLNIDFEEDPTDSGYNLYVGSIGNYYSHSNASVNLCGATTSSPSPGIRRIVYPANGAQGYFLVSGFNTCAESPTGFDSGGQEIDCTQNTCP